MAAHKGLDLLSSRHRRDLGLYNVQDTKTSKNLYVVYVQYYTDTATCKVDFCYVKLVLYTSHSKLLVSAVHFR